jgi:hypothetical protein
MFQANKTIFKMENQIQITNSENFYLQKRQSVQIEINLPVKSFLQKSYDFKKIKEIKKDPNFVFLVTGWITQTSVLMEIKNPIDSFMKQDIINMLDGYWSNFTFEEMVKAFEMERFGQFTEQTEHFQLFNSTYIAKVFKKYQKWKSEKKIELNISNEIQAPEKTEEEKFQLMTEAINRKYNDFKSDNEVSEPLVYIFDELVLRGLIHVPKDSDSQYWDYYIKKNIKARKLLEIQLKNQPTQNSSERKAIKKELDYIIHGESKKIDVMVKKLILIDFFTRAKNENKSVII